MKTHLILTLALCTCTHAADRFTLLGSVTWHGTVSGSFSVYYTSQDHDTIFATAHEPRDYGPVDYSGYPTWQLTATYDTSASAPCYDWLWPTGPCDYTAQWWNCPVETWRNAAGDYSAILDCRPQS